MTDQNAKHILDGHMSGTLERWRWREAVKFVSSGDWILDIACNEGGLIDYLPENTHYLGIDISETALAFARQFHPHHEFMLADLSMSVPDVGKLFDVAIMLAFIEHIKEPQHIINAVKTMLKPGGRIIITTPAPWARPVHDIGARLGVFSREGAEDHEKFLGRKDLYHLAEITQMRVAACYYFMFGFNQLLCLQKI